MKSPLLPYHAGWLIGALLLTATTLPAASSREIFLSAKRAATDANFRNDKVGLDAALAQFAALSADTELGPRAAYHAAWTEWMLAASYFQDQKPADARRVLESAVSRLKPLLTAQPDDAEVLGLLAWTMMAIGSAEPAQWQVLGADIGRHYKHALELAPRNPRIVMLDATMTFYRPVERGGGHDKALTRWREALELTQAERIADPTWPDWGRTLGEGWMANLCLIAKPPRPDEARALAEKALKERPDFWWVKTQVLPKTTTQP